MASIGAVSCDYVKGDSPAQKMRSRVWNVPGLHGYGVALLGYGDAPFEFTAVEFGDAAGLATWAGSIEALQGTIVTITSDLSIVYGNSFIEQVGPLQLTTALGTGYSVRGELAIRGVRV